MKVVDKIKEIYWDIPFVSDGAKETIYFWLKSKIKGCVKSDLSEDRLRQFVIDCMNVQKLNNSFSINYPRTTSYERKECDPKLIAYYLPQFYPDSHNTKWWGRGSTEWTNTSKSYPQYIGQYQPRLPGELGFYDLRIQDNIKRQIELANFYGIYGFCFYYYWFDGERVLDLPLDNFAKDDSINFPFSLCWVNESWTRQWSGASDATLIKQPKDVESYKKFINSCLFYFKRENYIKINGKLLLTIYRPEEIPNVKEILLYWRNEIRRLLGKELYLVAAFRDAKLYDYDFLSEGWDASTEFSPGPQRSAMKNITQSKSFVCDIFQGTIYDYKEFVTNKKYLKYGDKKIYRAICPMFDNTPRRANRALVLDGATPDLFRRWLEDIIDETKENIKLDDKIIFINAWNEWAEGAYLEPDLKWKYGYLESIRDAIINRRKNNKLTVE